MNRVGKRCLILCPTDTWGGVEKNVLLRARAMTTRGHKVTVALLKNTFEDRFAPYPEIEVTTLQRRPSDLLPGIYLTYKMLINTYRPDCLFVPLKRDWWAAMLCAHFLKVPHRVLYLGIKRDLKENLKYRLIFQRFKAHLILNSKDLRNHLVATNRYVSQLNTSVIYNGFEPKCPTYDGPTWRNQLNLPENAWVIGCAGRFSRQKGFDHLPDILNALPDHVHILVAGDGAEEKSIRSSIHAAGLAQRIHLIGNLSDMEPFYRSLDCFMLPSRNEGMANVLNEAMSYGLPVVSTRVPGSAELLEVNSESPQWLSTSPRIEIGQYGLLTNKNDTDALAGAISALINGDIAFEPERQRKKIAQDHDYTTMMDLTEACFFGTLRANPASYGSSESQAT